MDTSVLSPFEAGVCVAAVEEISRLDRPIAQVGRVLIEDTDVDRLRADLERCIRSAAEPGVSPYVRKEGEGRWSYGFYRHSWTRRALEFLEHVGPKLEPYDVDWISGLLYGYTSEAIQRHLDAEFAGRESELMAYCIPDSDALPRRS